jgi:hypothetical protein
LIKDYIRIQQTKFDDHPSIISEETEVQRVFFLFLALAAPKRVYSNQYEQT